jgi:RNA polymerase sigma-70 factor (ECF subfamily)
VTNPTIYLKVEQRSGHEEAVGLPSPREDGTPSEAELVRAASEGDERAFRTLFERHFDFVWRSCKRLGLPDADAEDAAQETFLVAHRRLADFSEGRLQTWLYRIAANLVSARHRKRRVREALRSLWLSGDDEQAPAPDAAYEQREAARRVGEVLARLAPKKREVFALFELEGLSGEEIAERVGCSVATVWTRLFHARKDFQRIAHKRGLSE